VIFVLAFLLLGLTLFGLLVYRQVRRLRRRSSKGKGDTGVAVGLTESGRNAVLKRIEMTSALRKLLFPRFSGCALSVDKPHYCRMMAFDAICGCDKSIESINPQLSRRPGEHTREYLQRMKTIALPNLDDEFIARFAFMHDWCRFVTEMEFGPPQLEEVRSLIATLSKLLDSNRGRLASLRFPPPASTFYVGQEAYGFMGTKANDWPMPTNDNASGRSHEYIPLLELRSSSSTSPRTKS